MAAPTQFEGSIQRQPYASPENNFSIIGNSPVQKLSKLVVADVVPAALADISPDSPIVDLTVAGLSDEVTLHSVRETRGRRQREVGRHHRLYTLGLDDFHHAVEVTDPRRGEPTFALFSFPGFSESIEGPFRQQMHEHLSYQYPQARIVSVGSNGIGQTGDHYRWSDRSAHTLAAQAVQRLKLARSLAGPDLPVIFNGTSMGTKLAVEGAHHNAYDAEHHSTVNLQGQVLLSPAIVDPSNTPYDMGVCFIPGMALDVMKELGLKTAPSEVIAIVKAARKYGLGRHDILSMGHQVIGLLGGTPEARLNEVVAVTPTAVVAGANDCLAQWPMWQRLQAKYPDTLTTEVIKGRGHGLPMRPGKAAPKIARASQKIVENAIARGEIEPQPLMAL